MVSRSKFRLPGFLAFAVAGASLAGLFVAGLGSAQDRSFAGPVSFADVVEQVSPAVVTVEVSQGGAIIQSNMPGQLRGFEEFFGRFGMQMPGAMTEVPVPQRDGVGSGFVIDADGYIATNYHVVEGARSVTVRFNSGESFQAAVVGTDPVTDLALLQVENPQGFPELQFGDSDQARVGEWVLAMGNPFGIGESATAGIISARGRNINAGPYDDFLQIDAAINSGNSGGPVFNAAGEVIGINTAIFSPTGGNVGIGFAIPANQARNVLEDLRDSGSVRRGWLGIEMTSNTGAADNGPAAGNAATEGVIVSRVVPGGPAEAAGLRSGDAILRFDGKPIDSTRTLSHLVAALDAGDEVEIGIERNGEREILDAVLGNLDEDRLRAALPAAPDNFSAPFGEPAQPFGGPRQADPLFPRR